MSHLGVEEAGAVRRYEISRRISLYRRDGVVDQRDADPPIGEPEQSLAEQRRDNCVRAQENMKLLQDGVRLTRNNEKGEPIVIDDRQRAEEIQRTRSVIDSECR